MSIIVNTLLDASTASLVTGLEGALDGFNTSLTAVAALFGEQYESDLQASVDQLELDFNLDMKNLEFAAIDFKINLEIQLENIQLEFDDMSLNIGVGSLNAIEPPQLGMFKWIDKFKWYILAFFIFLSILVLYDAFKIFQISNQPDSLRYERIDKYF